MKRKVVAIVLVLAASMAFAAVAPVFAKDMNLPEGADTITYWSGGICVVELTSVWPPDPAVPVKMIRIDVRHHEAGTYGAQDSINFDFIVFPMGKAVIIPVTYFTTNTDSAFLDFIKKLYQGLPIGKGSGNAVVVAEDNLKVERHGNRITAELKTTLTVGWMQKGSTSYVPIDIPPFKLEIDKVGGSLHLDFTEGFTQLPTFSQYVLYEDMMGFDGNSVLNCDAFTFKDPPGTIRERADPYCGITMHGITTYFPPPPKP